MSIPEDNIPAEPQREIHLVMKMNLQNSMTSIYSLRCVIPYYICWFPLTPLALDSSVATTDSMGFHKPGQDSREDGGAEGYGTDNMGKAA